MELRECPYDFGDRDDGSSRLDLGYVEDIVAALLAPYLEDGAAVGGGGAWQAGRRAGHYGGVRRIGCHRPGRG